jgi:hypothetical protein
MRTLISLLALALFVIPVAALAQPALAPLSDAGVRRNAQEEIPPAFIGVWKLDLAASHYDTAAPKAQYRIFDYTAGGKFLCDYITLTAKGTQSSGNWAVQLDGAPGIEYTRNYGSTPFAIVTLKKQDESSLYLTAARYGKVFEAGTFTVSSDGNTLTFDYRQGDKKDVAVYRRWDMQN